MRPSERAPDQMRTVKFTRHYTCHAEGSVLVEFGNTKVLCTATVEDRLPGWSLNCWKSNSVAFRFSVLGKIQL